MLDNLKLKKGDKVLIISELLDEMDWIKKLEKRTKFKIKDADTYVYEISQRVRSARMRSQFADKEPQDKDAKSVFYYAMPDAYPDEYFDVIWIPQGMRPQHQLGRFLPESDEGPENRRPVGDAGT